MAMRKFLYQGVLNQKGQPTHVVVHAGILVHAGIQLDGASFLGGIDELVVSCRKDWSGDIS